MTENPTSSAAILDLVQQHEGYVRALARALLDDEHAVDDVVQQAWLRAIESPPRESGIGPVRSWLRTVMQNLIRSEARSMAARRHREKVAFEVAGRDSVAPSVTEISERESTRREIVEAVLELPAKYRDVLVLRYLESMTPKAIARRMSLPSATVRSLNSRGLILLRERMDANNGGDRQKWCLALIPLAAPGNATFAASSGMAAGLVAWLLIVVKQHLVFALVITALAIMLSLYVLIPDRSLADAPDAISANTARTVTSKDTSVDAKGPVDRVPLRTEHCKLSVTARWHDGSYATGIMVRLSPRRSNGNLAARSRTTGVQGRVEFDDLSPGSFTVRLDRGASRRVELAAGNRHDVELTIEQGVRVHGIVVAADGQTVDGARIWMSLFMHSPERGNFVAISDRDGSFELRDVVPGQTISAFADGFRPAPQLRIPTPGTAANELRLELGHAAGSLQCTVYSPDGSVAADASVMIGALNRFSPRNTPPPFELRTDANGQFMVTGLSDGEPLWVRTVDSAVFYGRVKLAQGHGKIDVRLQRGAILTGTVQAARGPVPGRLTAVHHAIESSGFTGPSWAQTIARARSDGSYTLAHLLPGKLSVRVESPDGAPVVSSFELANGERRTWNILLDGELKIHGSVVDEHGNGLEGYQVLADAGDMFERLQSDAATGANGRFALSGAGDTAYAVVAIRAGEGIAIASAEGAEPGREVRIVVPRDRIASARFAGQVFDPTGVSIAEPRLFLQRIGPRGRFESGMGRKLTFQHEGFRTGAIMPGRYLIMIESREFGSLAVGERQLAANQTLDLGKIQFASPGALEVLVRVVGGTSKRVPIVTCRIEGAGVPQRGAYGDNTIRYEKLQPGHYRLMIGGYFFAAMHGIEIDVVAGRTERVNVTLSQGVERAFVSPPVPFDNFLAHWIWRDGDGHFLGEMLGYSDKRSAPERVTRRFVPGRYSVEVFGPSGRSVTHEFTVSAKATSDPVIELTRPR